jgi:hypothetical protein
MTRRSYRTLSPLVFTAVTLSVSFTSAQDPSQIGQWDPLISLPFGTAYGVLLKTGKVILIGGGADAAHGTGNKYALYDPLTGQFSSNNPDLEASPPDGHVLTCSGYSALRDGRILFNGGGLSEAGGTRATSVLTQTGSQAGRC